MHAGTADGDDFENLMPTYQPLVSQLKSLHDSAQIELVRKVAKGKNIMGALQITNPGGHDLVSRLATTKLTKVCSLSTLHLILASLYDPRCNLAPHQLGIFQRKVC